MSWKFILAPISIFIAVGCNEKKEDAFPDASEVSVDGDMLACTPGARRCSHEGNAVEQCREDGSGWLTIETCDADEVCSMGICIPGEPSCSPGEKRCTPGEDAVEICRSDGSGWKILEQCEEGETCQDAQCVQLEVCTPGERRCASEGEAVEECNSDGKGWNVVLECGEGENCQEGECVEEQAETTIRGFMLPPTGNVVEWAESLEGTPVNVIFTKHGADVVQHYKDRGFTVYLWSNFINEVRAEGSRAQILSDGSEASTCMCPNDPPVIEQHAQNKLSGVIETGADGYVGDGFRYAEKRRNGVWVHGGFCEVCRAEGGYGFEESTEANEFKSQVIDGVARECQEIFGDKIFGAFVGFDWPDVGQGHWDKLGENLGLVFVMTYISDDERFESYCDRWRESVQNDKLAIVLTWEMEVGAEALRRHIEFCESEGFNWAVAGNHSQEEQLQIIREIF